MSEGIEIGDTNRSTGGDPSDLLKAAEMIGAKKEEELANIERTLRENVTRDTSPAARKGRRDMAIRAAYGEFMCSILFYTPIFGCIANTTVNKWDNQTTSLAVAFVGGFQAIAVSFAFSSVSGAHFNSAITFALWLTGKLSNRKAMGYIFVQLFASITAMGIITAIFHGNLQDIYIACSVTPVDGRPLGKVFATEFFLTFFLTYVAFTVAFEDAEIQKKDTMSFKTIADSRGLTLYASTPQSKTGFAPFAIGLTIFSLSLIGGTSGGAFNPGRMFGPAVFSGQGWDTFFIYWAGQFFGSSMAGLVVNNLHRFGLQKNSAAEGVTAGEALSRAASMRLKGGINSDGDDIKQINPIITRGSVEM